MIGCRVISLQACPHVAHIWPVFPYMTHIPIWVPYRAYTGPKHCPLTCLHCRNGWRWTVKHADNRNYVKECYKDLKGHRNCNFLLGFTDKPFSSVFSFLSLCWEGKSCFFSCWKLKVSSSTARWFVGTHKSTKLVLVYPQGYCMLQKTSVLFIAYVID